MTHAFQFVFIWCDKQSVELSFINPFLSSEIIYPNKSLATLLNGAREKKCIKIDCLKEKCFGIRQWVKLVIDNKLITFCALGATHHVVQFHRNLNHLSVESWCDVLKSYTPISHWQLPWTVLQKKKCIKIYCSKEKCFGKRQWVEVVTDNKLIIFVLWELRICFQNFEEAGCQLNHVWDLTCLLINEKKVKRKSIEF